MFCQLSSLSQPKSVQNNPSLTKPGSVLNSSGANLHHPHSSQQQANQQLPNLSLNSNQKRNSIDSYQSPLSVYQQPPASMPPYYHAPPHTPLQKSTTTHLYTPNNNNLSFSHQQDPAYMAPHSVPTPSKPDNLTTTNHLRPQRIETELSHDVLNPARVPL